MSWPNSNEQRAGVTTPSVLLVPDGPACVSTRPPTLQPSTVVTAPAGAPSIDSTQLPR